LSNSIFALPEGNSLPLHDHPGMYGFIKCIHGSIALQSYSAVKEHSEFSKISGRCVITSKEQDAVFTETDKNVALLEPIKGNIHTITAIGGSAAFIDFLAPPYASGEHDCHYYDIESSDICKGIYVLKEVDCPSWFWTFPSPYSGPAV